MNTILVKVLAVDTNSGANATAKSHKSHDNVTITYGGEKSYCHI
jgi:hypothetical protein